MRATCHSDHSCPPGASPRDPSCWCCTCTGGRTCTALDQQSLPRDESSCAFECLFSTVAHGRLHISPSFRHFNLKHLNGWRVYTVVSGAKGDKGRGRWARKRTFTTILKRRRTMRKEAERSPQEHLGHSIHLQCNPTPAHRR